MSVEVEHPCGKRKPVRTGHTVADRHEVQAGDRVDSFPGGRGPAMGVAREPSLEPHQGKRQGPIDPSLRQSRIDAGHNLALQGLRIGQRELHQRLEPPLLPVVSISDQPKRRAGPGKGTVFQLKGSFSILGGPSPSPRRFNLLPRTIRENPAVGLRGKGPIRFEPDPQGGASARIVRTPARFRQPTDDGRRKNAALPERPQR